MVPLTDAFAPLLAREAAAAIGRSRRKRLHLRLADRKNITIGRERIGLFPCPLFVLLEVAVIEDLHFDARGRQPARLQVLERFFRHPYEDARIAGALVVPPLGYQLKVRVDFFRAANADRLASAVDGTVLPGPGILSAVDVDEILNTQLFPAGTCAVDKGF